MIIKQVSVFIENKPGRLLEVTKTLKANSIDIRSLSIADTTNFGIVRIIVNNPTLAEKVLKDKGFTVTITDVIAVSIKDHPGSLSDVIQVLDDISVSVEYIYAFIGKSHEKAYVVIKTENKEKAIDALLTAKYELLNPADIYSI